MDGHNQKRERKSNKKKKKGKKKKKKKKQHPLLCHFRPTAFFFFFQALVYSSLFSSFFFLLHTTATTILANLAAGIMEQLHSRSRRDLPTDSTEANASLTSAPSSVRPSRLQVRRAHTVSQGSGARPIPQTIIKRNLESTRAAADKDRGVGASAGTGAGVGAGAGAGAATGVGPGAAERGVSSTRRTRDSREPLKQSLSPKRSLTQHGLRDAPSGLAAGREPNHFTVGSVGQNGKIFLR